jgi:NADH dehydrogenase
VAGAGAAVTLISRENYFQFTPMLYEYLSGEVKRWQIAPSYTDLLGDNVRLICDEAAEIDLQARMISLKDQAERIAYDVMVLAVGGTTNYEGVEGAQEHALPFRTLADADALRERMAASLDRFSRAETPPDAQAAATFVVVGGSASGVELATKMADLLRQSFDGRGEPRVLIVEESDKVVAEMDEDLRAHVLKALKNSRVEAQTETKVLRVTADSVSLQHGDSQTEIKAAAVVWTGGVKVNPLVEKLPLEKEEKKQLIRVEDTLQARGYKEVFALGDIAHYSNADKELNGTAQLAYQQAGLAAANIKALLAGRKLQTKHFKELGKAVSLGTKDAAVEIGGHVIGGAVGREARFAAYTARLPTWHHRLKVGAQWLLGADDAQPLEEPR